LAATTEEIHEEYVTLARRRSFAIDKNTIGQLSPENLLEMIVPPGCVLRLKEWQQHRQEHGLSGPFMCDIEHHAGGKGTTAGSDWPVQLTHGHVMSISEAGAWRLALGTEHFSALGFRMHLSPDSKLPVTKLKPILGGLAPAQQKLLAGNGMHLVTQCAWQMYVLSDVVRVPEETVPRSLASQDSGSEWGCSDDELGQKDDSESGEE